MHRFRRKLSRGRVFKRYATSGKPGKRGVGAAFSTRAHSTYDRRGRKSKPACASELSPSLSLNLGPSQRVMNQNVTMLYCRRSTDKFDSMDIFSIKHHIELRQNTILFDAMMPCYMKVRLERGAHERTLAIEATKELRQREET